MKVDADFTRGASRLIYPELPDPLTSQRYAWEGASGAVPKHWRKAWRITCPTCNAPFSDTNERPDIRETLRDTSPFEHLWPEALAGEEAVERFLGGDVSF